jgi:hypothetical protein
MSNPSLLCVPYRFKTSKLYSQIPDSGLGDFTVTRTTTPTAGQATRVNAQGLIELVADNVPRLDYPLGGITAGCPSLLVEPSAQNLLQRSEEFENAYWSKSLGVVTQNQTIAPDGLTTADKYVANNGVATNSPIVRTFTFAINTTYTLSLFVKKADYDTASIRLSTAETPITANFFNLASGTATNNQIQNYGNGWYRVWVSFTTAATVTNGQVQLIRDAQVRDGVAGIFIWGAQLEVGSVPTSYIPTVASSVTRGAEVVDRTGISSLMGQTEGTFYLDMSYFAKGSTGATLWLYIIGTPTSNNIGLGVGVTSVRSIVNGQSDSLSTPSTANGVKIAWGYDGSGVVCFVNGVQYNLPNGGNQIITSMNRCVIDMSSAGGTRMADVRIRAIELYPTRLPNTGPNSLQSLTQ